MTPSRRQPLPSGADKLLRSAIDDTRELADRLDEHLADRQWPPEAAARRPHASTTACNRSTRHSNRVCRSETAGEDKQTLRRIAAVLAVPLVSGQERNWLRDRYLSIAQTITPAGAGYQVAAGQQAAAANADAAEEPIQRLWAWDVHPVELLLDSGDRPTAPPGGRRAGEPRAAAGGRDVLVERLGGRGTSCAGGLSSARRGPSGPARHGESARTGDVAARRDRRVRRPRRRLARAAAALLDARLRGELAESRPVRSTGSICTI